MISLEPLEILSSYSSHLRGRSDFVRKHSGFCPLRMTARSGLVSHPCSL